MTEISDVEFANRCRECELPAFLELAGLLGDDVRAARALRAEEKAIHTPEYVALNPPKSQKFATQVRTFMAENKLEWNTENLLKTVLVMMGDGRAN